MSISSACPSLEPILKPRLAPGSPKQVPIWALPCPWVSGLVQLLESCVIFRAPSSTEALNSNLVSHLACFLLKELPAVPSASAAWEATRIALPFLHLPLSPCSWLIAAEPGVPQEGGLVPRPNPSWPGLPLTSQVNEDLPLILSQVPNLFAPSPSDSVCAT